MLTEDERDECALDWLSSGKEDVLANGEQVADDWLVVASESRAQDRLTVEYNWLYGRQTRLFCPFPAIRGTGFFTGNHFITGERGRGRRGVLQGDCPFSGVDPGAERNRGNVRHHGRGKSRELDGSHAGVPLVHDPESFCLRGSPVG